MPASTLRRGSTKSCGCLARELTSKRSMLNLAGERFSRLRAIKRVGTSKWGSVLWKCRCDCGKEQVVCAATLMNGQTKSCGCLNRERSRECSTKHGYSGSPTYRSWSGAKGRCSNPNHVAWEDYGGRGITICERWRGEHGFENFLSDMGPRPDGMTLDRRNNGLGYSPDNCRWATPKEQSNNRRRRSVEQELYPDAIF